VDTTTTPWTYKYSCHFCDAHRTISAWTPLLTGDIFSATIDVDNDVNGSNDSMSVEIE
jgi:hypothetical protein